MPIVPLPSAAAQPSTADLYRTREQAPPARRLRRRPMPAAAESEETLSNAGFRTLMNSAKRKEPRRQLPDMPDDYVGKYYPPKVHRWQKGQSGNPSGKKGKGKEPVKNTDTYVREVLGQLVPVNTASGESKMNAVQIALSKVREMAAKGHIGAIRLILEHWTKASLSNLSDTQGVGPIQLSEAEQDIIEELLGALDEKAKSLQDPVSANDGNPKDGFDDTGMGEES